MTIERNDILAVIPTYNNEKTLARVIGEVRRYCTDVLVVNDGSTDSTAGIIAGAGVGSIFLFLRGPPEPCAPRGAPCAGRCATPRSTATVTC